MEPGNHRCGATADGVLLPDLVSIVVAIDPAASSGEDADETGIVVAGKDEGVTATCWPIPRDTTADRVGPNRLRRLPGHRADRIVAESNNGGEMVEATIRMVDENVAYTGVHATRGKVVRAEPVAALYEQGRIHHIGAFTQLEDQMCEFTPDLDRSKPKRDPTDPSSIGKGSVHASPDRADALVWAFTEILVEVISDWGIYKTTRRKAEAILKEKEAARLAGIPKPEFAPGSLEYQALHPGVGVEARGVAHAITRRRRRTDIASGPSAKHDGHRAQRAAPQAGRPRREPGRTKNNPADLQPIRRHIRALRWPISRLSHDRLGEPPESGVNPSGRL